MRAASLRRLIRDTHLTRRSVAGLLLLACVGGGLGGCFGTPRVYAPNRVVQTPPLSLDGASGVIEITMQAPNPGWRLEFDTTKASRDGPRLLFTVRRPDPGMIFVQQVVDKAVRTDQPPTPGTRVWVRALDHGEKGGRYSPTDVAVPEPAEPNTTEPDTGEPGP
ncbi:MAG: hypothetical protein ACI89L_000703 [Phycisphaerales bacterium]|jgi:hypothetical protein